MKIAALSVVGCLGLLAPGMALAQSAPASEPAPSLEPVSANPAGAPLICKYYYHNGEILHRRDCRTAHEWERLRSRNQSDLSDFQNRSLEQRNN
jgi:hypothetical protein